MTYIYKNKHFTILIERATAETESYDLHFLQVGKHSMLIAFSFFYKWCYMFLDIVGDTNSGIQFRWSYESIDAHAFGRALACK